MSMNSEEATLQTLEERIIAKAMEDPAYKQRLISESKAVVEEEFGHKLAEDVTIQVLQQSSKHLYLLLPVDIDEMMRDALITQQELEAVAGGRSFRIPKLNSKSDVLQGVSGVAATLTSLASALYGVIRSRKA